MSDQVVSLLQATKDRLVEVGWYGGKGGLGQHGEMCVGLALLNRTDTKYSSTDYVFAMKALKATMGDVHVGELVHGIPEHNDICLTSDIDAFDWIDESIAWAKDQREWPN